MIPSHLDRTSAPLVCSVLFRLCTNSNWRAVKRVRLRGLAVLARGYEGLSAPRMLGLRGSTLVRDTGAETPCSNCTTNSVLPGSSSTSATTAGNQHPSHTHTGSCRLICACDGSISSSVPERTAGKNYWQVALRNIAQRRPESKLRLKTCALALWPLAQRRVGRVRRRLIAALVEPHRRTDLIFQSARPSGGPGPANAPTGAGGRRHKRGTAEQRIEECKPAVKTPRLSCHSFLSGEPVAAAGTAAGIDKWSLTRLQPAAGENRRPPRLGVEFSTALGTTKGSRVCCRPAWNQPFVRPIMVRMRFDDLSFGSIRIDGVTYEYDVVVDRGKIRRRK